jgi:hypothetical protein
MMMGLSIWEKVGVEELEVVTQNGGKFGGKKWRGGIERGKVISVIL